jgi:hypothetical protein
LSIELDHVNEEEHDVSILRMRHSTRVLNSTETSVNFVQYTSKY